VTQPVTAKLQSLLQSLRQSILVSLSFEPTQLWVQMIFSHTPGEHSIIIELRRLIHFVVMKDAGDEDGFFFVGDISLIPVKEEQDENISPLIPCRYPYSDPNQDSPAQNRFYLYIDGGIHIEAVFEDYRVFQRFTE
jgi:hypothetical protein